MYGTNALLKKTILCIVVVLVGLVVMCNDVVLSPAVIAYLPVTECMSDWEIFLITISFFSSLFYLQLPRHGLVLERLYFQV